VALSKSQLHPYFADKDALVLEVIARMTERVLDAQRSLLEASDSLPAFKAWRTRLRDVTFSPTPPASTA
jgi:TetR/AcrR family transcriptional repressor of nem operon